MTQQNNNKERFDEKLLTLNLKCQRCSYVWTYRGGNKQKNDCTCPHCKTTVQFKKREIKLIDKETGTLTHLPDKRKWDKKVVYEFIHD